MPRRKKGNPVHGWLLVDKPLEIGSTNVVSKARWAFQAQKAGHAGTLDPLASGLLAVAFGEATKTIPYAGDGLKTYEFDVAWGAATATDDLEGPVIGTSETRPSAAEIAAILPQFLGEIQQRPPAYSAVHVGGERAYERARRGEEVKIAPRPIRMEALRLVARPDESRATFKMTCGKGGYVRSIARDLGEALGCLAHVIRLRRIAAGPFHIRDAISFDLIESFRNKNVSESALLPVAAGLDDIPALSVDRNEALQLMQGRKLRFASAAETDLQHGDAAWASHQGTPVAIGVLQAGEFHPSRVFNLIAPEGA